MFSLSSLDIFSSLNILFIISCISSDIILCLLYSELGFISVGFSFVKIFDINNFTLFLVFSDILFIFAHLKMNYLFLIYMVHTHIYIIG